jgi:uncharacterized protein (TIGR02246 family)
MNLEDVRALVARQARAWEQGDINAALADFATDALYISPGGSWQGHEAIRRQANDFFASTDDVVVEVKNVFAMPLNDSLNLSNAYGAIEWAWHETRRETGARHRADDAIIFELRDGKIVYWREYFDTAQMETQIEKSREAQGET